jgi:eukaryotic-like serine/threonine-protein kinase
MIGTKLAHYEITSHIGSGGMGDVYQATDTKLGRSVAIKFLPEAFSHDTERVSRFQREARVLASLNHSNIAAIYGVEEIDTRHFLVMELVSGETMADRIKRRAIPIEEALPIAKQIAEALEEAHNKGIIHRDLKPANIKLTPNGNVKLLDFGLAKAYEREQANAALSNSPTISMAATNAGVILGTAAYMSPQQARGRAVDKRTDMWALGCVLYEMLTGNAAFGGDDVTEILASVVKSEPDWSLLPTATSASIRRLLRRCLEKDCKRRLESAADARLEIEEAISAPAAPLEGVSVRQAFPRPRMAWMLGIPLLTAIIVGIAVGVTVWNIKQSVHGQVTRLSVVLPADQVLTTTARQSLAVSPDGSRLVYVANGQLFSRSMDEIEAKPVAGTNDPVSIGDPFFSPDSQWIAFWSGSDSALKKVSIAGGPAITLCKVRNLRGASWQADQIVFGDADRGIMRVSASGGEPEILVNIKPEEGIAYGPQVLDGAGPRSSLWRRQALSKPRAGIGPKLWCNRSCRGSGK